MKKALSFFSMVIVSATLASAQVINVGGTAGGVPVTGSTANGGVINIGVQAAQGQVNGGPLLQLLALAQTIVSRLGIFAVGVAVLAFFWFLILFIWKGREDGAEKTRSLAGMGYAILAIFVMVSIWGIVGALGGIFGIGQGGSVPIPGIPVPTN
jgi:hypothetical protein